MKAGETMYLGYRKETSYLQNITFTPTETPEETVTPTENPIQTSNPQSTPKADVERKSYMRRILKTVRSEIKRRVTVQALTVGNHLPEQQN